MEFPLSWLLVRWRSLLLIIWPLALLPLALSENSEIRCGYVVLILAAFWITEAAPLPVTSLLPVLLFPILGILSTGEVCIQYLTDTNMMFIGGLILAIAMEHCNLHKRIALKSILIVGTSPARLLFGLMVTTMFISMWISNTAATAMMVPIVKAVLDQLNVHDDAEKGIQPNNQAVGELQVNTSQAPVVVESGKSEHPNKETIGYYLGIAYAASIGGTGTLIGTGTNLTFKGLFASIFPDGKSISFTSWLIFCAPLMLVCTFVGWLVLMLIFMGLFSKRRKNKHSTELKTLGHKEAVNEVIRNAYKDLGPMTFHEGSVLFFFILAVLLWFLREPEFMPGWASLFPEKEIDDSTPVVLICFLLFTLPANLEFLKFWKNGPRPIKPTPPLITWKIVNQKMHWGIILLLGGGFAMAEGTKQSGLNAAIGESLEILQALPQIVVLIVVCIATTFLTQFASNTAIANIVLPVLAEMSRAMEINPLYFMMPACLCCSYAFMLPVSTPGNAIVLGECNMKVSEMMKAGFIMCIVCILMLCLLFPTFGMAVYHLDGFPDWAKDTNSTNGVTVV